MKGKYFFILSVSLALVDFLIPYLFLKEISSFLASYLFWCALSGAVILFAAVYTNYWRS